jgi:prepilin-type N-terminal cleavage/methylation domain-containing protein
MGWKKSGNRNGFTLLELMVTVAIIGVLVTVAVTLWMPQKARAKQEQAKAALGNLRVAMEKFRSINGFYYQAGNPLEDLPGYFEATNHLKEPYVLVILNSSASSFQMQATCEPPSCNIDGDNSPDTWTIDQDNNLNVVSNDVYD